MDLSFAAQDGDWDDEVVVCEKPAPVPVPVPEPVPTPRPSRARSRSRSRAKGRPESKIHRDPHTRYFVIKSSSHKNIVLSIEHQVWATPRTNQEKLNEAFRSASYVILAFSVTGSGCFQGYAKMLSPVGSTSTEVFQGFGRAFQVRWLRLDDLDFAEVSHIRNPWNENKSVKMLGSKS